LRQQKSNKFPVHFSKKLMRRAIAKIIFVGIFVAGVGSVCHAQPAPETPAPKTTALGLDATQQGTLEAALRQRDYKQAEMILMNAINANPTTLTAAKLLVAVAGIFFLDGDFLNSAVAYKKAEKLAPLDEPSRFTLAMAYLKLKRPAWAVPELERLTREYPNNALYLYWLARIDYDAQKYPEAVAKLKEVIRLDPRMVRAYDNLGLCYEHLSDNEAAIQHYRKAIELNRTHSNPSPWPPLNLAILFLGRHELSTAETLLQEALKYDAKLPQAHYNLGLIQEKQNNHTAAIFSLQQAIALAPNYAEPHYSLSRIYQKLGDKEKAQKSLITFQQLKQPK
jgi:tetratricopeptide (TPR) repeat protein